ncbi:hypothetical protein GQ43DRAFT_150625 [Delitschia confertaspora ATCC 74209]|uniref:Uncharacterized protein n=1 Tax=Delitschia confertaspora ATCC 74209 TaxID=1513339 RepID=A0A9P4MMS3_9PLEO|nr:hypothetical protein GQ43DRAFT_150625 [Delitschia confertaspora ATCC 74209]
MGRHSPASLCQSVNNNLSVFLYTSVWLSIYFLKYYPHFLIQIIKLLLRTSHFPPLTLLSFPHPPPLEGPNIHLNDRVNPVSNCRPAKNGPYVGKQAAITAMSCSTSA